MRSLTCTFFSLLLFISSCGPSNSDVDSADENWNGTTFPPLLSEQKMTFRLRDSGYDQVTGTDAYDRKHNTNNASSDPSTITRSTRTHLEPRWIAADGVITPETADDFVDFMDEICDRDGVCEFPGDGVQTIALNSYGGSLMAGMQLGRDIRNYGLRTSVTATAPAEPGYFRPSVGQCLSACAYAFLGGVHRRLDFDYRIEPNFLDFNERNREAEKFSSFGVHRFREDGSASLRRLSEALLNSERFLWWEFKNDCNGLSVVETTQCIDAKLVSYIREMGVDPEFFESASAQSSDGIRQLSYGELRRLKVITDLTFSNWRRGVGDLAFTKFSRPGSWNGVHSSQPGESADIDHISFFCSPEKVRSIGLSSASDDFVFRIEGYTLSNEEPWILVVGQKRIVLSSSSLKINNFVRTELIISLSTEEWNELFDSNELITLTAYPVGDTELPLEQRRLVQAHIDREWTSRIQQIMASCT